MKREYKIIASVLADNGRYSDELIQIAAPHVDGFEVDYMDGRFVDRKVMGPGDVAHLRKLLGPEKYISAHLMAKEPNLKEFADAGANSIIIHKDAFPEIDEALAEIKMYGKRAGYALSPSDEDAAILQGYGIIQPEDILFLMGVQPGKSGQQLHRIIRPKIKSYRHAFRGDIQIDGGVKHDNIGGLVGAGANFFTVSSAIFKPEGNIEENVRKLREAISRVTT